jgi:hypothetical protein
VALAGKEHDGDVCKRSVWLMVKLRRRRVICAEIPLTMLSPKLTRDTGVLAVRIM